MDDINLESAFNAFVDSDFKTLKTLVIKNTKIGNEGMLAFTQAIEQGKLPKLEDLALLCTMEDARLTDVARAIKDGALPSIRQISIGCATKNMNEETSNQVLQQLRGRNYGNKGFKVVRYQLSDDASRFLVKAPTTGGWIGGTNNLWLNRPVEYIYPETTYEVSYGPNVSR